MTRNLRTQLADAAERWMRAWAGNDLPRESAEVLYTYWDLADPHDDELRDLVLSRFPCAEPPSVPGLDWLPAVEADAKQIVAEVVASAPDWSRYGECPVCAVAAGACVFVAIVNRLGQPRETPHEERPLVEVQPWPCPAADRGEAHDPHDWRQEIWAAGLLSRCDGVTAEQAAARALVEVQPDAEAVCRCGHADSVHRSASRICVEDDCPCAVYVAAVA